MVIASDIPVRISEDAARFIAETGIHEPLQRVMHHIPRHFRGVQGVNVVLDLSPDQSSGPCVVFEVTREDPGVEKDESDWEWRRWEIESFTPEHLEHFVVFSYYPLVDNAR